MRQKLPQGAVSWALYDWANSAFSTTVIAGFFPIFFKDYWSAGVETTESTFLLGVSISIVSLLVALYAPFLGSLADQSHSRKRFLFPFVAMGCLATLSMFWIGEGQWLYAIVTYGMASLCYMTANVFYDSLLVQVSDDSTVDFISGVGYSIGYLGGGLLFLLNATMVQMPETFGFESAASAVKWSFVSVALWWFFFSLPLFFKVPEPRRSHDMGWGEMLSKGFWQLRRTFQHVKELKVVALFLVAYWLYIDGVDTVVVMAVDYGRSVGFPVGDLLTALLLVQFIGFPFALIFGWLGQRFGAKPFILLAILIYSGVTYFASTIDLEPITVFGFSFSKFYVVAFLIGSAQGGIQSLSRSLYSRLIPADKAAEFFGFYNMIGKFAAIIGPALMGIVTKYSGDHRTSILSILVLFFVGGFLLLFVNEKEGQRMASQL